MERSSPDRSYFQNVRPEFTMHGGIVEGRLLPEYGAIFVAHGGAIPPPAVVFADESEVSRFQTLVGWQTEQICGFSISLQPPAMKALLAAIDAAAVYGMSITPRGADSGRRRYDDTIALWASRVEPALDYWTEAGRISREQAESIRSFSPVDQAAAIFQLEEEGIFFAKDLSKSVIYSVAPPGTSQHLAMLAFDAAEFDDLAVRDILASHGWFQTVTSDLPHFTYLGMTRSELPGSGLKPVISAGREFWLPDL
ncbi:MAG: hypothetical protein ABI539_02215 [Acidobacteriota bacterium]